MPTFDGNNVNKGNKELIENVSEQLFAFLYMENSDHEKYGSLLKGLNSQKSLGHDQYPRTLSEANNVLSNHKLDATKQNKQNLNQQSKEDRIKSKAKQEQNNKTVDEAPILSFAQMEGRCYCCRKPGHKSPDCRSAKDIKREDWAINKLQSHATASGKAPSSNGSVAQSSVAQSSVTANSDTKAPKAHVGWAGVHCSFAHAANLKDLILLDSDSTDTVFCNPEYVTYIQDMQETLQVLTNGGPMKSHQKCDVPHLGVCWYNKDSITNIIAMCDMRKKFLLPCAI
jgi:hypothetical protein